MKFAQLFPIASVCAASMIWGTAYSINKTCLQYGTPPQILILQLGASVVFLALSALVYDVGRKDIAQTLGIWWTGILEPGLTYLFGITGLKHFDAGLASVIISSESVVVMVMVGLLGWERLSLSFVWIALLSFAGVCMMVMTEQPHLGSVTVDGSILLLLSTFSAATYAVISYRMLGDRRPLAVALVQQIAALAFMFAINRVFYGGHLLRFLYDTPLGTLALISASGILQYALGFLLFLYALKFLSASRASIFLNLIPVFGIAIAVLVLGETLTITQGIGALIAVSSLLFLGFRKVTAEVST